MADYIQTNYMKKFIAPFFALVSLASCIDSTTRTPLHTAKRLNNCKRVVRPIGEAVVYAIHIDTAYRVGDTIRVEYTHDESRLAVVVR
jgi:hypothetical protein